MNNSPSPVTKAKRGRPPGKSKRALAPSLTQKVARKALEPAVEQVSPSKAKTSPSKAKDQDQALRNAVEHQDKGSLFDWVINYQHAVFKIVQIQQMIGLKAFEKVFKI